jgi:hypothetical protein
VPTPSYVARISKLTKRSDIYAFWQKIRNGQVGTSWPSGKALEYLILRAFELEGASVTWPYSVRDEDTGKEMEQIDGAVYCDSLPVLIESKDTGKPKNHTAIAKLKQQLTRRPGSAIGAVFARSGFTPEALLLTARSTPQNILLWNGEDIDLALKKGRMRAGLNAKFRKAVERAVPDWALSVEWP